MILSELEIKQQVFNSKLFGDPFASYTDFLHNVELKQYNQGVIFGIECIFVNFLYCKKNQSHIIKLDDYIITQRKNQCQCILK